MPERGFHTSPPALSRIPPLAEMLSQPVCIFDLETTTVYGNSDLGIIEYAAIVIEPNGRFRRFHGIAHPEAPADPEILSLTALQPSDWESAPAWPDAGASLFAELAASCLCVGYGIQQHDIPTLHEQAHRYNIPIPEFRRRLDLAAWRRFLGLPPADLAEACQNAGLTHHRQRHFAAGDTLAAAQLFDRMLFQFGFDDFLDTGPDRMRRDFGKRKPLSIKHDTPYKAARFVMENGYTGVGPVADFLAVSDYEASRILQDAVREGILPPERAGIPKIQRWLLRTLPAVLNDRWVAGGRRLKPLYTRLLRLRDCPDGLDYVQLQTALRQLRVA